MTLVKLVTGRRRWPRKLSHAAAATAPPRRPAVSAPRLALLSAAEMRRACPTEKLRGGERRDGEGTAIKFSNQRRASIESAVLCVSISGAPEC